MDVRGAMVKRVVGSLGLSEESSMAEILETAGEFLGAELAVNEVPLTADGAAAALLEMGKLTKGVLDAGAGKLLVFEANKEGLPPLRALCLIG